MKHNNDIVQIWTDGSLNESNGVGGWAAVIVYKYKARIIGGYRNGCTSNQAEAEAVLQALLTVQNCVSIRLHTDSAYVKTNLIKVLGGGKTKTNQQFWSSILELLNGRTLQVYKVPGHSKHIFNLIADVYAHHCATFCVNIKETHNGFTQILNKLKVK